MLSLLPTSLEAKRFGYHHGYHHWPPKKDHLLTQGKTTVTNDQKNKQE
jgi:hypothetical protein